MGVNSGFTFSGLFFAGFLRQVRRASPARMPDVRHRKQTLAWQEYGFKVCSLVTNVGKSCFLSILSVDIADDDGIAYDLVEPHGGTGRADRCPAGGIGCSDSAAKTILRPGRAPAHGLAGGESRLAMAECLWRISLLRRGIPAPGMQGGRAGKNPVLPGRSGR